MHSGAQSGPPTIDRRPPIRARDRTNDARRSWRGRCFAPEENKEKQGKGKEKEHEIFRYSLVVPVHELDERVTLFESTHKHLLECARHLVKVGLGPLLYAIETRTLTRDAERVCHGNL